MPDLAHQTHTTLGGFPSDFGDLAREWADEQANQPPKPRQRETRLGRVSLAEISTRKIIPPDYVIDDWMIAREQSFLAGESQSGKSFLALHAGLSVAVGRDVLGKKVRQGLVIYQAGESGFGVTGLRIPAWLQHYGEGVDPTEVPFEILPARINLFREGGNAEEFHQALANIAAEWRDRFALRLVIIDTLSKAMAGANENDGRDIGRVLEHCERISRDTGAHVVVVHHLPKNGVGMRGHGSLKGDTDSVVMVKKAESGVRSVTFDKVKDGAAGGVINFDLMQVTIGHRDEKKPITSCVCLPLGEKELARKAEAAAGFNLIKKEEQRIFTALLKALDRYGQVARDEHEALGAPPGRKVVEYMAWRDIYAEMNPEEDGTKPDGRVIGQRFRNNKDPMVKFGVIGLSTPWMWWTGKQVKGFPETRDMSQRRANAQGDNSPTDSQSNANELPLSDDDGAHFQF